MKITELCMKYELGKIIEELKLVTGGLMHKMYHVSTDQGEYAKSRTTSPAGGLMLALLGRCYFSA